MEKTDAKRNVLKEKLTNHKRKRKKDKDTLRKSERNKRTGGKWMHRKTIRIQILGNGERDFIYECNSSGSESNNHGSFLKKVCRVHTSHVLKVAQADVDG